jgi:hypothetical protein
MVTGCIDTGGKLAAGVNYAGGKFANDTGNKFAACDNHTGDQQWQLYRFVNT